jgi:hypothetical protein
LRAVCRKTARKAPASLPRPNPSDVGVAYPTRGDDDGDIEAIDPLLALRVAVPEQHGYPEREEEFWPTCKQARLTHRFAAPRQQ